MGMPTGSILANKTTMYMFFRVGVETSGLIASRGRESVVPNSENSSLDHFRPIYVASAL